MPKATQRFDNLLEGLTEFIESYYTPGYNLLQRKDTLKLAKERDALGRVQKDSEMESF